MRRIFQTVGVVASLGLAFPLGCIAAPAEQPAGVAPIAAYASPYTAWPIRLDSPSGVIDVYQPQPEKLEGDKLTARAAVSVQAPGAADPVFGAIWMQARVATDRDTRTISILDLNVRRVRFPDSQDQQQQQLAQVLQHELPRLNVTFALDELMTSLDVAEKEKSATAQLQTTPPKIIFTTTPATLITIDGPPKLQQAQQPGVMRVVNTPFILLLDMPTKRYYLKAGDTWMTAADVTGPWANAATVPQTVAAEAQQLAPPPDPNAPQAGAPLPPPGPPGQIIVAEEPTELISTDGEPQYTPVLGNELLYVTNTQSDVFMEVGTQQVYVLLSGRWYHAPSLRGPWEYVAADKLPPSFARIPPNSPKAYVLASVAGTMEAKDARLDAAIPQTAAVTRDAGASLNVPYDGEPVFEPIQETPVSYCSNTPEAVLLVNSRYYCCHQAVWYESAVARGPWAVCVSVPQVIYTIPPSCPVYHVRYVYVYDYTPTVVYVGYLPGYTGCFVYGPTVVYGTGYLYPAWYRTIYVPRARTWGFGARYDIVASSWGEGAGYRWDRRWLVGGGERHEWWGPRGFVDYRRLPRANEPRTQIRNVNLTVNIYNRTENVRRNVTISRGPAAPNLARNDRSLGNPPGREARPPVNLPTAHPANDVYAGRDGQVYRRTDQGWEQRSPKGWTRTNTVPEAPAERPAASPPQREQRPEPPPRNEAPTREPAREPAPRPEPRQPPQRVPEPPRQSPGLEADHAARERGAERARNFEGPQQPAGNDRRGR
jgi:hypothetical protein